MQTFDPKIKFDGTHQRIWDPIRKKYVVLTPEEWVRQQLLFFMIHHKHYPPSLISVEKKLNVGNVIKRYDIIVYHGLTPWLLVECKKEDAQINKAALSQILAYLSVLSLQHFVLSNGIELHRYDIQAQQWHDNLPEYPINS